MAENELVVTAGLNFNASESLILSQLETIQNDFNKKGGLQINCTVNNDSLKAMQSQLSSLKQTLDVDVNASYIRQSINQATKVEPVKINVTAEINKGELQRQAKEIEKALSIQYPKGQTQQLRDELKAYLSNYQKAIASNDLSGMETAIEKIAEFAGSYRKETEIVNEELKYQQDRTREILKEQEKLYITAEQYAALQREVSKDGRTATQVLNSSIGVGRWSTDITKFDPRNLPYWSKFATEVNNINPLKDAILNEGDIVQGINDLNAFLGKSVDMTSQYLKANEQTWVEWRDIVHDAVSVARGEGSSLSNEFVNLLGFEDIATTEKNVQAMAEGMRTIQALKEQYIADTNVKNVTADWTKTAEGDLTGFTVNVQKATGEVERFRYEIDELNQVNFLGSSGSDRGIAQMFERATKSADSLERKILNLKAAADDVSAPRPITSNESINKVSQAYNNATEAVQKLRTADASTFGELENQAKIAVDELNNVIKAARNADTAATKLRAKPIEVIKQEEAANLEKFVAQISNSAIPKVDALVQGVDKLRDELNKIQPNDKQGLANYLDNVSKLDSEFKALDAQAKTVKSAISDLDKVLNNSQLNKNVQNPNVTSLFGDVTELKGVYTNLFNTIGSDRSADTLKRTGTELLAMKSTLENIVNDATQLERNLRGTADAERQQHDYWQGRFEESIKGMTAENEELKKMRQYYADLENVAQTSLGTIKSSYEKIVSLNAKLTSGKLPEIEANSIRKQIEEQEVLVIKARQKLETEGLYTEEIAKQINGIKQQAEAIIDARNQQKASNEELAKSINTYEDGLTAIHNAYKAIADATKTLYSDNKTDVQKSYALADIAVARDLLSTVQKRLAAQGLINSAIEEEIKKGEILVTRTQQETQSTVQAAQAKRDERDAERELTKQARQRVEALKERNQLYSDLTKWIDKYLQSLNAFNNSSIAKKNSGNSNVASQVEENTKLIEQLEKIKASLSQGYDATKLKNLYQEFSKLSDPIKQAAANSAALKQSLLDTGLTQNVSNQIRNLTNQMNVFANTNRRATESLRLMRDGETTFADEWQRIKTALSSGTLDDAALKRLAQDFHNFKGEADAAGMTVSRFFQSMQSQLRMVLQRWISLYAVIGYIRKMIDNVKELDNAMINLRRVTDETDAGYQRFLEDANKLARQMKTTTASLVEMSYQWSKLGYSMNEALELSKASTIFMRVADVGQDQALSNLVTSLKAFRLEASQTMDVVDKLDKLNNEYAVSAAGLGEGLERSASAMAMSGNTLEETLAMLTGAGEITQNLENTGNGIKILSLRLRGMKGALEELNEPVDDLMEVSKIQTQILNLTHNQVNIFDEATQEFRSTYDIMKDISDIWDSLSSTSRANLTEILFGKQRANIGLALIQAFQSGQVQSAFEDAKNAAGTATEEYSKMMQGIQAQFDAFKGAFQEFSNAFIESDFLKGFVKLGTKVINFLTAATDKVGSLVLILTPFLMYFGGRTKTNIFSAIINGLKGLVTAETGAITASGALTTALKVLGGAISGLAIGALVAGISYVADKLIVTSAETEESIREISSDIGDLAKSTEELEKSQTSIENIAQSYSKVATTVTDVNERKSQLLELQNQLADQFKDEAGGIDFVNGKYSEQIKKLQELSEEQRRQYEIENADKIARARRLANLRVDDVYKAQSSASENGYDRYSRNNDKTGERAMFTIRDVDERVAKIASDIEGAYASLQGTFDVKGIYLSGTLEDARNQLKQIIDNYSKLKDVDSETLEKLTARYKELNNDLNEIKEVTAYIEDIEPKPVFTGIFDGLSDAVNQAVSDVTMQPFYDKLDEAQDKLKQLANPNDLTIAEYDTLYRDVQKLEGELYKMAGDSEDSKKAVADLFNGFKQGTSENGDNLEKFVEHFNTALEESFKKVAETVTGVQDAMNKLAEGKGLSHSDAWKLLKEDTDGYLQSIKLVNGEYFFSQEELIKFKDAKIKASMEDLKASNEDYAQERKNRLALLETQKEELKLALENLNVKAAQGLATRAELDAVTKARIAIAETEDSIKRYEGLWKRNNYLIEELNQNLGETRTLSLATETELNNAVKALENEAKAIKDTVDELNNRKDILESEKTELQNQLELLKEQKKALEDQQKGLKDAVEKYMKRYEESLKTQLDTIKQQKDDIKDEYDERIKALKNENEERDLAYKKEKALLDLNKAKQQQVRTYSSARGWEHGVSKEKLAEAQKNLDDVLMDEQIHALEKERDEKVSALEKQEKEYDKRIKAYQEYAQKYEETTEIIENADGELLAEQLLGADWREKIEKQDEGLLASYKKEYSKFADEIDRLTKNEIADIEASIKAKEAEINKIGEEIKAYNNYKDTVQTKLGEAKTELENYKNNVADYCNQISDSFYHMQDEIWNNHNKIIGWFGAVAAAARSMRDEIGTGAVGGAMMGLHLAGFANGGVVDSTGLAMLHGTKQKGEVIFNAADSKKLYDLVHNTPSLIASVAKQAGQLTGTNITNNNGSSTNNINVNIGQVVANNPQEFTRNLDTHLDSYFRRKLTQSYTQ